jgi:hypothetical protein
VTTPARRTETGFQGTATHGRHAAAYAVKTADLAGRVFPIFGALHPDNDRPGKAIEARVPGHTVFSWRPTLAPLPPPRNAKGRSDAFRNPFGPQRTGPR